MSDLKPKDLWGPTHNHDAEILKIRETSIIIKYHSKNVKAGHYRPASETPSEWRFADGPIVTRDWMLAGVLAHAILAVMA